MDTAMAVDVAATVAGVVALVAARQRRAIPAAAATALELGLLMAYWELMARYYDRHDRCAVSILVTGPGTIPAASSRLPSVTSDRGTSLSLTDVLRRSENQPSQC